MKQLLLLFALLPCLAFGQKARIVFEKTSFNFGTIYEAAGKVAHDFTYRNTGDRPLILTNVRSGCGCAVPYWSRKPVLPGAEGKIRVYFDPKRRPGTFVKSIAVNSNASNSTVTLTVRGLVDTKPLSPFDAYRYRLGGLRFSGNCVRFGNVLNTMVKDRRINIANSGDEALGITVTSGHRGVVVLEAPKVLEKGEKGSIVLQFNPRKADDWGYMKGSISIATSAGRKADIEVSANVMEDFSGQPGDRIPAIRLSETGTVLEGLEAGKVCTHSFYIQNTGRSELILRKTAPSDPGLTVQVSRNRLKPGRKAKVSLSFRTDSRPRTTRLVQIISNAPENPEITYSLTTVLKK